MQVKMDEMLWIVIILTVVKWSAAVTCPEPEQPTNGEITCPHGTDHFSLCVVTCNPGYDINGPSRHMCWCAGNNCAWKGAGTTCERTNCDMPFYDYGQVYLADSWPRGFAVVAKFDNVPQNREIFYGWSFVIVFDRPLGKNVSITSYSAEMSGASFDGQTFTMVNLEHNEDLSYKLETDTSLSVLLIVTYVDGELPTAAYIGLYDTRIQDASCVMAPKMPSILPVGAQMPVNVAPPRLQKTTTTTAAITTSTSKSTKGKSKRPRKPRNRTRKPSGAERTTSTTTTTTTTPTTTRPIPTRGPRPATTRPTTKPRVITTTTTLPSKGRYCVLQRADDAYVSEKAWTDRGKHSFNANAKISSLEYLDEWSMVIVFEYPIKEIQVWAAKIVDSSDDGLIWTFGPLEWDSGLASGETSINFIATTTEVISGASPGQVFLCSDSFTEGDALMMRPQNSGSPPPGDEDKELSRSKRQASKPKKKPTAGKGGGKPAARCAASAKNGNPVSNANQTPLNFASNNDGTKYNYNELLHKSILFFEAQRSGKLPSDHRVPWLGNSALKDGCDLKVDASGGWYDAGNWVKYNFPMAFSLTTLAWGGIAFRDAYEDAGEMHNMINLIKWPTKYFIKCHTSKYELIGQVGNSEIDDSHWGRPEEMTMKRPTYKITANKPGTELAAETAAALAASSIFLKRAEPELSTDALKHAKELYEFADTYRGMYHKSIPSAAPQYRSYSGFDDELVWAAAWMYKATNDNKYLKAAGTFYTKLNGQYAVEDRYVWDRKLVGAQALLAEMTGNDIYRNPLAKYLDELETAPTNSKGMYFLDEWGPNRYTSGAAFMVFIAGTLVPHLPREQAYMKWAKKQMGMILGDTGRSFVIGFGDNSPKKPRHRASSCPPYPQTCDWSTFNAAKNNHYILYGGLVGGPGEDGDYEDDRDNDKQNHVACDYNAVFQSAIAGMKHFAMKQRGKQGATTTKPTVSRAPPTKKPEITPVTSVLTNRTPLTTLGIKTTPKSTSAKPVKTRPTVSENKRCARESPTGVPVRNAKQTTLNFKPNNDGTKHNYNKVLHMSILFFEAQRAGRLPLDQRVSWRGDSTLKDGCEVKADVSGGWFDAGDHVKFCFPMAFSLTTLAWGGIEFRKAYEDAGELQNMIKTIKWGTQFFINAHTAKFELIGQVGNGKVDHDSWGRPETLSMKRPVYKITAKKPGTELAAEAAAGLAASSIFLKQTDPQLSTEALRHAKELYEFADKYRGLYHESITDAKQFYESVSGYDDELIWGAAWLYKATNDNKYLKMASNNYNRIKGKYVVETRYSWDRKLCGAQAILGELTGNADYKDPFFEMIDGLMRAKTTPQGMFFLTKWGSNRYAAGAAFMATIAANMNAPKKAAYQKWAQKQVDLMLGDSGQSYVVGYGGNYPKRPHHRSSSCPPYPQRCDWQTFNDAKPNYYILHGALVGGPDEKGKYLDKRNLYEQTEVTTDYNACFQSAVAGVKNFVMKNRGTVTATKKPSGTKKPAGTKKPSGKPPAKKPRKPGPTKKPGPKKPPGAKGKTPCKPFNSPRCKRQRAKQQKGPCKPPNSMKCKKQKEAQQKRRNQRQQQQQG